MNTYQVKITGKLPESKTKEYTFIGKKGWRAMHNALKEYRKEFFPKTQDLEHLAVEVTLLTRPEKPAKVKKGKAA